MKLAPDKLTSIGLAIASSWENWLEKNCEPEIDFYSKIYSQRQIPRVITQPDFLFSTFDMVNLQIDFQNLLVLPWPFSGNFHKTQGQFSDKISEREVRYSGGRQLGPSAFLPIPSSGVHKDLQTLPELPTPLGISEISYLASKNLAPLKATEYDKKSESREITKAKEFKNSNVTQNSEILGEKRTSDPWDELNEISEKEQIDQVLRDQEKNDTVTTENLSTPNRDRYPPNAESSTDLENRPNLPYFEPDALGYGKPKWKAQEDKKQDNSVFSTIKGWDELAKTLNDKSSSGNSTELTSPEVANSSIITTDIKRSVPEVSEIPLSTDTNSTFRNLSAIGKEKNTKHLPISFTDMAMETPALGESETLVPDTEELYEALAAKLRREYNRYYGP